MDAVTATLYSQPGCVDSGKVRQLLRAHGVPFVERDVSRDAEAAAALARTGIFATPLLMIGERTVFGYRAAAIEAALADAGLWGPDGEHARGTCSHHGVSPTG